MKIRWVSFVVITLAFALVGGLVVAQQRGGLNEQAIREFNGRNGRALIDEDIDKLTGPQKLDRSQNKIATMKVALESTDQLLGRARTQERDILKINCISEKLAAVKGFVKVSEQSYVSLSDSVGKSDNEASKHHYTLIAIAGQKVGGLSEEARVCAGEEVRYADDTMLDVTIDPDIMPSDESFWGDDPLVLESLPKFTPYY
ncbi:MAG: hypothetical protein H0U74_09545 [Bradymonadaceae bacterium]|nr:hypothetical protein [Lujinxingiaceae bacterium]